jgi:hypothetical protein
LTNVTIKTKSFRLLHFTDAVVHEKARGMSLLKKMNEFILNEYKDFFDYSYIFFPNKVSGHIYRNQGHKDFQDVFFSRRSMVFPLIKKKKEFKLINSSIEIYNFLENQNKHQESFKLDLNEDFIKWRMNEPSKDYQFFVSSKESDVFVWIEIKPKSIEIQMLNFKKLEQCLKLAKSIAVHLNKWIVNFPILSTQNNKFGKILSRNLYFQWYFLNKLRPNTSGYRPILSKALNDKLTKEEISLYENQELWEYHNIIFV